MTDILVVEMVHPQRPFHRMLLPLAGVITVGSDRNCTVVLDGPDVDPQHLFVIPDADGVRLTARTGASFRVGGIEFRDTPPTRSASLSIGSWDLQVRVERDAASADVEQLSPTFAISDPASRRTQAWGTGAAVAGPRGDRSRAAGSVSIVPEPDTEQAAAVPEPTLAEGDFAAVRPVAAAEAVEEPTLAEGDFAAVRPVAAAEAVEEPTLAEGDFAAVRPAVAAEEPTLAEGDFAAVRPAGRRGSSAEDTTLGAPRATVDIADATAPAEDSTQEALGPWQRIPPRPTLDASTLPETVLERVALATLHRGGGAASIEVVSVPAETVIVPPAQPPTPGLKVVGRIKGRATAGIWSGGPDSTTGVDRLAPAVVDRLSKNPRVNAVEAAHAAPVRTGDPTPLDREAPALPWSVSSPGRLTPGRSKVAAPVPRPSLDDAVELVPRRSLPAFIGYLIAGDSLTDKPDRFPWALFVSILVQVGGLIAAALVFEPPEPLDTSRVDVDRFVEITKTYSVAMSNENEAEEPVEAPAPRRAPTPPPRKETEPAPVEPVEPTEETSEAEDVPEEPPSKPRPRNRAERAVRATAEDAARSTDLLKRFGDVETGKGTGPGVRKIRVERGQAGLSQGGSSGSMLGGGKAGGESYGDRLAQREAKARADRTKKRVAKPKLRFSDTDQRVTGGTNAQRKAIRQVISRANSRFRRCLDRETLHYPNIQGRIVLEFDITAGGKPQRVRAKVTPTDYPGLSNCAASVVKDMRFESRDGQIIHVNYPLLIRRPS